MHPDDCPSKQDLFSLEPSRFTRRWSIALIATVSVLFLGIPSRAAGQTIGISKGQADAIVAGIAGTGAAIAIVTVVLVSHVRHTMTGCVSSGANGLALHTSDQQIYLLQGASAGIRPGDRVKLHGSKVKSHSSGANPKTFVVEKLEKDYGECH
jgi:hypothetical protein